MKMRKLLPLAVLGALAASNAQAVVIDTFGSGNTDQTRARYLDVPGLDTLPQSEMTASATAIGGSREVGITAASNFGVSIVADGAGKPGELAVSNEAGITSTSYVLWNNQGGGLGGENLTLNGADALKLKITEIDLSGGVTLTFDITDMDGDVASLALAGLGLGTQTFLFSSFSNFAATDFASVNSIKLTITATIPSADLTLDLVETAEHCPNGICTTDVPEIDAAAGTGAIALLGGMVALRTERRRRRA